MDHNKNCDHSHCTPSTSSVCQTLSEMDWEKGLWYAAFYNDEKRVQDLIYKAKNAKELVNTPDNGGYTPLHYAARKAHINICKMLLENGAIINAQTKSGQATPLHKAAAAGNIETIKFLIYSGAQTDMQDADGQTILHKAVENKHSDLVNYLQQTYPNLSKLKDLKGHYAADYM